MLKINYRYTGNRKNPTGSGCAADQCQANLKTMSGTSTPLPSLSSAPNALTCDTRTHANAHTTTRSSERTGQQVQPILNDQWPTASVAACSPECRCALQGWDRSATNSARQNRKRQKGLSNGAGEA